MASTARGLLFNA